MKDLLAGITKAGSFEPKNPKPHSPLGIQNRIRMQVVGPDETGNIVTKHDKTVEGNIMCTYGLNRLCELVATGGDASNWFGGMRIGTGNTAAASTDNALVASTGSVALTDATAVIDQGNQTVRSLATFASDNPAGAAQIREIGIFVSSGVTTGAIARRDLTGAESVNKGASDSINVSYDIVFTTAS